MKIFQFYKTGFIALLIFLTSPLPVSGNPFHNSLPDPKREEIKIVDNHTVEVGIGPDNRSVSCNILDAVRSIPYVGAGGEPDIVFVNKEKVHHFRKGLYTWDREGNYRVRLTTKYIREFGNIRIRVPEEGTALLEEREPAGPSSTYLQNLPQNIKEEITIIDENMVEVAIGPDDHSVSSTILHAVKSIPSAKEDAEPGHVFVNDEPIHHIKEGVYAWDMEGKNPVRLSTKYIREFGNIQIHITGKEPPSLPKAEPEPVTDKKATAPPAMKEEPPIPPNPSPPLTPKTIRAGMVKGFRLAQFGMGEEQVVKAIQADFDLLENKIERRRDPESGQRILTIASLTLDPENGKAWIHYYLSSLDQTLNRVDVIWGHPEHSTVDQAILQKSADRLKNLFRQLETQTATTDAGKGPYIYYGVDILGNGIKLMWNKPYDKDFQPTSKSKSTLALSYFQP